MDAKLLRDKIIEAKRLEGSWEWDLNTHSYTWHYGIHLSIDEAIKLLLLLNRKGCVPFYEPE